MSSVNGVIEIEPGSVAKVIGSNGLFLDVREQSEWDQGHADGANLLPMSNFMPLFEALNVVITTPIALICRSGARSRQVGEHLARLGFESVFNVSGGTLRWQALGLPMRVSESAAPENVLSPSDHARYARHLALPQVGLDGQKKLLNARALIVGAGGLGSPAAFYLAAAGLGALRIVDPDTVDVSNLQRQILHTESRVGQLKVQSAGQTLKALNPQVKIEAYADRITSENVGVAIADCDVVIDGADNLETRYVLNDACARQGIPLVYGAIHRFDGQVSVFDVKRGGPCYRCLFPNDDGPIALNCAEAGVLGVLPGVIGTLQASEAIKLILGIGEPLRGRVLCFDALAAQFRELKLSRDPACKVCQGQVGAIPESVCHLT